MKTLLYDIEICHSYDDNYKKRMYSGYIDTGIRMSADISIVTHFGYKWLGDKRVYCKDLTDFKSFEKDIYDEKELLTHVSAVFAKADHLVGHYSAKFDHRYLNAKFLKYGLPPIPGGPAVKESDTCKLARQHLKLSSNRLDNVAKFLDVPMKRTKNWPEDWIKMTRGDKAAFKRVKHYCIGDIISLEEVYLKLRQFSGSSPNISYVTKQHVCISCGSKKYVKYGSTYTKNKVFQRYRCQECSKIFHQGQLAEK